MDINRMKNLLLELCGVPSISGTSEEINMAKKLHEVIMRISYFKNNRFSSGIIPIKNDPLERSYVYGLMEGKAGSKKTVVLLSHFDVVDIENYGALKDFAFDPVQYTRLLKDDPGISLSEEARADLDSGDYIFGRGTMDMKFGIALDVEIMHQIENKLDYFPGNILFLSVPDEENNSAGMLSAVLTLKGLKEEKGLEYVCCIVSEPHFPKYPGDNNKYIYVGTVGKLLPVFFCAGKETHAGDPFSGLNPNLLTARIIEKIEQNPELSDAIGDFRVPAPVCLKHSDTKNAYSVSTPSASYTYFNFMTVTSSPNEVLKKLSSIAKKAFTEVLNGREENAGRLQELTGSKPELPPVTPMIMTFNELYKMCLEAVGKEFEEHMKEYLKKSSERDLRELSVNMVREAHKFCPYRDPMIVLFFAPPYYPHSEMRTENSKIVRIAKGIINKAKSAYGENILLEPFFPGLSDMSYLSLTKNVDIEDLKDNFPVWSNKYSIPLDKIASLNIPFINIGPLGKDVHKNTERLCVSYSFDKTAKLALEAVLTALDINPGIWEL